MAPIAVKLSYITSSPFGFLSLLPRRMSRDYLLLFNSFPHFNKDMKFKKFTVWIKI